MNKISSITLVIVLISLFSFVFLLNYQYLYNNYVYTFKPSNAPSPPVGQTVNQTTTDKTTNATTKAIITPSDTEEEITLYNKGNNLYTKGNYQEAIMYYDKVLEIDPNDVDALNGKGSALDDLGKYEDIILYDKVLAIDPNDVDALKYRK